MSIKLKGGGLLPLGGGSDAIQVGYRPRMTDATTPTANQSPLTVSSSSIELKIPTNTAALVLFAGTNNLKLGDNTDLDGSVGGDHFILTAGNFISLDVAGGNSVFVQRDSADVSLSFYFVMLDNG